MTKYRCTKTFELCAFGADDRPLKGTEWGFAITEGSYWDWHGAIAPHATRLQSVKPTPWGSHFCVTVTTDDGFFESHFEEVIDE